MNNEPIRLGSRVELIDGIERDGLEHGEILSFHNGRMGDISNVEFARVQWDDGTISSTPLHVLENEDLNDDWGEELFDNDDIDLEGLF